MDIRTWLQGAIAADQNETPSQLGLAEFLQPRQGIAHDRPRQSSRHTLYAQHCSPLGPLLGVNQEDAHARCPRHRSRHSTESDLSDLCSSSSTSLAPPPDKNENHYQRRPRHKTRPDRYEPKERNPNNGDHKGKRKKHGQKRRKKTRRKHRSNSASNPVYVAKNVSKDRLTFKPKEALGLFKKGRASSPQRGRGLPDLVFSEMRFLRRSSPHADKGRTDSGPRRRKKAVQTEDEEISTFFSTKRMPLAEREGNARQSGMHQPGTLSASSQDRAVSPVKVRDERIIELPAKPYLGFGSKGAKPLDTSKLSWSESICASLPEPLFNESSPAPNSRKDVEPPGEIGSKPNGDPKFIQRLSKDALPGESRQQQDVRPQSAQLLQVDAEDPTNMQDGSLHILSRQQSSSRDRAERDDQPGRFGKKSGSGSRTNAIDTIDQGHGKPAASQEIPPYAIGNSQENMGNQCDTSNLQLEDLLQACHSATKLLASTPCTPPCSQSRSRMDAVSANGQGAQSNQVRTRMPTNRSSRAGPSPAIFHPVGYSSSMYPEIRLQQELPCSVSLPEPFLVIDENSQVPSRQLYTLIDDEKDSPVNGTDAVEQQHEIHHTPYVDEPLNHDLSGMQEDFSAHAVATEDSAPLASAVESDQAIFRGFWKPHHRY